MLHCNITSLSRIWQTAFIVAFVSLIASCGGGSTDSKGYVPYTGTGFNTRALPQEFVARTAVNYSPYRTSNRDTETPSAANVLQDLNLLIAGNIRLIRLFDSSDKVAKLTLDVIRDHQLDMKVQLGIWVDNPISNDDHLSPAQNQARIDSIKASNNAEIARGIALAKAYSDIVLAVSVGNEQMVNWSANMDPNVMASYLSTVREQISQPITSDDDWSFWAQKMGNTNSPTPVLNSIDFVAMHSYPMAQTTYHQWDWHQASVTSTSRAQAMMSAAIVKLKDDYAAVRANLDLHGRTDLPIIVGETGWRAENTNNPVMTFRAGRVNQRMYYTGLLDWAHASKNGSGPANVFYFEAFDEPWKGGDDKWGLFNVNRQARCAVQNLSSTYVAEAGNCSDSAAAYWVSLSSSTPIGTTYTLYSDSVNPDVALYSTLFPNVWEGSTSWPSEASGVAPNPVKHLAFTVTPKSWGWGQAYLLDDPSVTPARAVDLSGRQYLNFSIKTAYPGPIEVGFVSGSVADSSNFDVLMKLSSGQYGYVNDGAWHDVKIPVSNLISAASTSLVNGKDYRGISPDVTRVTQPFVIADRYTSTGNQPFTSGSAIEISRIFWSSQ